MSSSLFNELLYWLYQLCIKKKKIGKSASLIKIFWNKNNILTMYNATIFFIYYTKLQNIRGLFIILEMNFKPEV